MSVRNAAVQIRLSGGKPLHAEEIAKKLSMPVFDNLKDRPDLQDEET